MTTQVAHLTEEEARQIIRLASEAVSPSEPDSLRVREFVRRLVEQCRFYPVHYNDNGSSRVGPEPIRPEVVLINEVEIETDTDNQYGRSLKLRTIRWVFNLKMRFSQEVTSDQLDRILEFYPRLKSQGESKQITVSSKNKEIRHPAQRRSSGGSRITYTLDAGVSRN